MNRSHLVISFIFLILTSCEVRNIRKHPLSSFIEHPVVRMQISHTSTGCFHYSMRTTVYEATGDRFIATDSGIINGGFATNDSADKLSPFKTNILRLDIYDLLSAINDEPGKPIHPADLNVNEQDKQEYFALISKEDIISHPHYLQTKEDSERRDHYLSFPARFDTLSPDILMAFFDRERNDVGVEAFTITLVNRNNDTLLVGSNGNRSYPRYYLPWYCFLKGREFKSFDPRISAFMNACIPGSMSRSRYRKSDMLQSLSSYLYYR